MAGPLTGLRVLDLSHMLNGPFATMLLAHMGAEVLKVEYGAGDRYRRSWMPPDAGRDGYQFLAVNANKKSITLNLKTERGRGLFLELVKVSDVVVENFTTGVMERLGIAYETLAGVNPRLVYASSRGYGEEGPYANVRALAPTIQAMTGWTHRAWQLSGRPGSRVLGVGDEAAGASLAVGVLAALYHRSVTGEGQRLEVAMQESQIGFMTNTLHHHFEGQDIGGRIFPCADGHLSVYLADLKDDLFERLAVALGHREALEDERFSTPAARRRNFAAVEETVGTWLAVVTRDEVWPIFRDAGIPSAPVLSFAEVLEDENITARGSFVEVEHKTAGRLRMLRPWIRFGRSESVLSHAGPAVGEHNEEVYARLLNLGKDELAELARDGVI